MSSWPTCPFCGIKRASDRGLSVHRIRCAKNPDRKVWSRRGRADKSRRQTELERKGIPTSVCHRAPIRAGKRHQHGDRYCTKCGKPCYWRSNQSLAVGWTCKGNARKKCMSILHYRDGYCKNCWELYVKKESLEADDEDDMI